MRAQIEESWIEMSKVIGIAGIIAVILNGCASYETAPQRARERAYRDLVWTEENQAWHKAEDAYEKSGEAPLVGAEPQCSEEVPPCIVERARWKGVARFREHLFDSILRCDPGQAECEKIRASERAMRKLAYRRWRKARDERARLEAERLAREEERIRVEEEAKLSEWRELQEEERSDQEQREQLASLAPSTPTPAPSIPHDWEGEAHGMVRALQSARVGCSASFGETQYLDRVWALSTLDAMGQGDAATIAGTIDASHGRGTFQSLVARARAEVDAFLPRRCIAGL